jgi:hypothetical protein
MIRALATSLLSLVVLVAAMASAAPPSTPATPPATAPKSPPASQPSSRPDAPASRPAASQPATSRPAGKFWKETYPDGKLKAKCPMVKDPQNPKKWVKHGLWQGWFPDGKLQKEGHYKYDKMDGEWKIWFPGVEKPYIEKWVDGKKIEG